MIELEIPHDEELLAAVGVIAIRHGQLDHVLRMTIKSIARLPTRVALDATHRQGSGDLRSRVRKLAKQKLGEGTELLRFDALLQRSRRASDRRNELLHRVWAKNRAGDPVIKDDDHNWGPIPTTGELEQLANELAAITAEIDDARLIGFLQEALVRVDPPQA